MRFLKLKKQREFIFNNLYSDYMHEGIITDCYRREAIGPVTFKNIL